MLGLILALALLSSLTLACGSSGARPDENTLRRQVAEEWAAFLREDWESLYQTRTAEQRASCSADQFNARMVTLPALFGDSLEGSDISISNVKIDGNRATFTVVVLVGGQPFSDPAVEEVVWEDGRWREAAFDPC